MGEHGEWFECYDTILELAILPCFGQEEQPCSTNDLASATLLDHLFRSCAVAVENTENIDLKHPPDIIFREIEECFHLCDACVGYHDIEGTEILDAGLNKIFNFGQLGYIGDVAVRGATLCLDLFNCLGLRISPAVLE